MIQVDQGGRADCANAVAAACHWQGFPDHRRALHDAAVRLHHEDPEEDVFEPGVHDAHARCLDAGLDVEADLAAGKAGL